jgi:DNA polymerase III sliding clamp (beta) subunit (PCNA family)
MDQANSVALTLHKEPEPPPPDPIRLPAETPPPPAELPPEVEAAPTVEQISKNELRLMEESKNGPPPDRVLEAAPMIKPSLVAPVHLNGKMFQDFLDAFSSVAAERAAIPIMRNVLLTYSEGELRLEATDNHLWAIAKMKAQGGSDGFECVLPLKRARNIVRRMLESYPVVSIGVDAEHIHIGHYSFPHGGNIRDYPKRPVLLPEELKAALPAHYIECILERLVGAIDRGHDEPALRGVHLDFEEGVAVATDGRRVHVQNLAEMEIVTRQRYRKRPGITLSIEFFEFLRAVVDQRWVPLIVNEKMVTAAGEDFGLLAKPLEGTCPNWRQAIPRYAGCWIVDKITFVETIRDAQPVGGDRLELAVDSIGEQLIVTTTAPGRGMYRRALPARRMGGPPAIRCRVNPQFLRYAVESTEGCLVRLGFDANCPEQSAISIRGEKDDFLAVIMPRLS